MVDKVPFEEAGIGGMVVEAGGVGVEVRTVASEDGTKSGEGTNPRGREDRPEEGDRACI